MTHHDFTDPLLEEIAGEVPSGFQRAMGYKLLAWNADEAMLEMPIEPRHRNRAGVVHGGVLAALIDTACGFVGTWHPERGEQPGAVTLSLTTSYVSPAREGVLRVSARKRGGGTRTFFAAAEIHDQDGTLIAFGEGAFRYRSGRMRDYIASA
ncbi:MAG: PaaI family thioesterase [Salinarimonadaceae bacterium]|nr:MAG: PaaI family thioesterase [Salinarimonadaceae bacterium]